MLNGKDFETWISKCENKMTEARFRDHTQGIHRISGYTKKPVFTTCTPTYIVYTKPCQSVFEDMIKHVEDMYGETYTVEKAISAMNKLQQGHAQSFIDLYSEYIKVASNLPMRSEVADPQLVE